MRIYWMAGIVAALVPALMGGCGSAEDRAAREHFESHLGEETATVFPACVHASGPNTYDTGAARDLAAFLRDSKLMKSATTTGAEVPITTAWGMNQSRMYRDSLKDFQAYLAAHPVETDYALLPEYLVGGKGDIVGIHLYVLTKAGKVPYGVGLNSHHAEFNAMKSKTADEATQALVRSMRGELHAGGSE
jgi:hypothetical protein